MTRAGFLASAALLAFAACSDSPSEPPTEKGKTGELTVQITATAGDPVIGRDQEGGPVISCDLRFRTQTTGTAGAEGDWTGGVIRYFVGAVTEPIDSLVLTKAQVKDAFGDRVAPGETHEVGLDLVSIIPFALQMELRYGVVGKQAEQSATTERANCGIPQGTPGPVPDVSELTIDPSGEVEPGDTLRITWTSTGSPSVWETGVEVTGAFTAFRLVPGEGQSSLTHTALVVVPRTAVLGETVQVRVYAIDPWARVAASIPSLTQPVVDRTPPTVYSMSTTPLNDLYPPVLKGQYGVVDTMHIYSSADDNHELAYMVYEFGPQGVRDSVSLRNGGSIPMRPQMVGATEFRAHFMDGSGNRSREFAAAPGAVRVYPVRNAAMRSVEIPQWAEAVVVDPVRKRLYTVVVNRQELRVYSLETMALERTVPLPFSATDLELTADADSLLVSSRSFARVLAMDVNATVAPPVRPLQDVTHIHGIQIASTGRAIALALMTGGENAVLELDLGTGAQRVVVPRVTVPFPSAGVARSRDRRAMLLGAGCTFNVLTEQVGTCRTLPTDGIGTMGGSATGDRWGHTWTVFDGALQPVLQLDNSPQHYMIGIVPAAGGETYVAHRRGVVRVRADGAVVERLATPPLGFLRLSDDGSLMATWGFLPEPDGAYRIYVLDPR
jgi:hypothetical protein